MIGITNAKYSSGGSEVSIDNIGFAIPINSVKSLLTGIIENGGVVKPYIGISIYDLGSEYQMFGLSGVAIQSVEENSPAAEAGLKANDVITKVNDNNLSNADELVRIVSGCSEGDVLKLTVNRQGEILEIEVKPVMKKQTLQFKSADQNAGQSGRQSQPYFDFGESDGSFPFSGEGFPG